MEAQRVAVDNDPFANSQVLFARMCERLGSGEAIAMTHSEVERLVAGEGREILRQLLQDHVDLRGARERAAPALRVVGEDGIERPYRRDADRNLRSVVGDVVVPRVGYSAPGQTSRFPTDARLNLPRDSYSLGVRQLVALAVASCSFEEAAEQLERTTGTHVPKRQAEQLARSAAVDFEAFYAQRAVPTTTESSSLLVLSADAKGIVVRRQDLRPATRKAAEQRRPKLKTRLTKGEKKHAKRMAMVTSVYAVAPHLRTVDDVLADLRNETPADKRKRPKPEVKRTWATIERDAAPAIAALFDEAQRRDPGHRQRWVVLVDGNRDQLSLIEGEAKRRQIAITVVLDVIHVLSYLWSASTAFHAEGSADREQWVLDRVAAVLRGRATDVAAGMRRSATRRNLTEGRRGPVDKCADYLLAYKAYLHYDQYLRDGLPIATGVIEGACRHLVKDRMDLCGAHWSLAGAEAILQLRAIKTSDDMDAYWAFHETQEYNRNHASRYEADAPRPGPTRLRLVP